MKRYIVYVLCAFSFNTLAQTSIAEALRPSPLTIGVTVGKWILSEQKKIFYAEVVSEGYNEEQARHSGFKLAVEKAIGSVIASETEVQNNKIVRNEIVNYASGYVEDFEIVAKQKNKDIVVLEMKVWVSHSALSNRLLNTSQVQGHINSDKSQAQLETLQQEKQQGDKFLNLVLSDFPRRAFDLELGKISVGMNVYRAGFVEVPFVLKWNYDYLLSLWRALDDVGQKQGMYQVTVISGKPPKESPRWFGWAGNTRFSDPNKLFLIKTALIEIRPAVQMIIKSATGTIQHQQCYHFGELDYMPYNRRPTHYFITIGSNSITVNGDFIMQHKIELPVTSSIIGKMDTVNLAVIRSAQCT